MYTKIHEEYSIAVDRPCTSSEALGMRPLQAMATWVLALSTPRPATAGLDSPGHNQRDVSRHCDDLVAPTSRGGAGTARRGREASVRRVAGPDMQRRGRLFVCVNLWKIEISSSPSQPPVPRPSP